MRHIPSKILYTAQYVYHKHLRNFLCINKKVECNICGWRGWNFHDVDCGYGHIYREASCPVCKSQHRHRAFYHFLDEAIPKDRKIKLLHFAPEQCIQKKFYEYGNIDYLSVDIDETRAMKKEDITNLSFDDNSFDMIFCSHVLEHIEDDKKAMDELYRVLKKGGLAVLDVPLDYSLEETYEDKTITSPEGRTKAFLQHDHLRLYGRDFPVRLSASGFNVEKYELKEHLKIEKVALYGTGNKIIYSCTK